MKKLLAGIFIIAGTTLYCERNDDVFETFKDNQPYYFEVEDGLKTRVKLDLNGIKASPEVKAISTAVIFLSADKQVTVNNPGASVKAGQSNIVSVK